MPGLERDGVRLSYRDAGTGPTLVLQHGLGGDAGQPAAVAPPRTRLVTLECRGHGESELGPPQDLRFDTYAEDLRALLDALGAERAVVGGISMGAGVAARLAHRHPERIAGLVLVRPAWLDRPSPSHLAPFPEIAGYLRRFGAGEAARLRYRERSRLLAATRAASPAAAASLLGQFDRPGAVQRAAVLEHLVADAPLASLDAYAEITARAVVIATAGDPIHPSALARRLASALPHAELRVVPGKDESPRRHETAVRDAIAGFVACATLRRA